MKINSKLINYEFINGKRCVAGFRSLDSHKSGIYLFCLCFAIYVLTYTGRLNYTAAITELISSGVMTKDTAGIISMAFYLTYGAGQFINGFLGDSISPFMMIGSGVTLSGLINLIMGTAMREDASVPVFAIIWAVNGYIQSSIWSPLIRIISTVLPEEQRAPACSNIIISTAVGTFGTYLLSTLILETAKYDSVFTVPGLILTSAGILWFALTNAVIKKTKRIIIHKTGQPDNNRKNYALFPLLFYSGVFFMFVPTAMMSMMKDGITTWTPTIISEIFDLPSSAAVLITSLLPFSNMLGAAASQIIVKRWMKNEMKAAAVLFSAASLLLIFMLIFGMNSLPALILIMAFISSVLIAVSNIFIGLVPYGFGNYGRSSTVTGLLNSANGLFCSLSSLLVGFITEHFGGWNSALKIWIAMGFIGIISSSFIIGRWEHFKQGLYK